MCVCAGGGGGGGLRESHKQEEEKDIWYKIIHRTGVFRRLRNAAVSASLTVCG